MKIELTQDEVSQIVGALILLSRAEKDDYGLRKLADKITRQNLDEFKREVRENE